MSGRNRDKTLDDLHPIDPGLREEMADELEDMGDLREGVGGCWMDQMRACDRTCMAFNSHKLDAGEHPCLVLVSLQAIVDPAAENTGAIVDEMQKGRRAMETIVQRMDSLTTAIQQAASRIR